MSDSYTTTIREVCTELGALHLTDGFQASVEMLNTLKLDKRDRWRQLCQELKEQPCITRYLACPLLRRGREKPRGYAGDAVMLDYMYGVEFPHLMPELQLGPEEEALFQLTTNADCTTSARNRMKYAVNALDKLGQEKCVGKVLSVACGHAREVSLSSALANNQISSVTLLDQDPYCTGYIDEHDYHPCVQTVNASISLLLKTDDLAGPFDLIYSLGLYDYLPCKLAQTLTKRLFDRLTAGGRLLIGNYTPNLTDGAFMEAVMDWWLIYRNFDEMRSLAGQIPQEQIASLDIGTEDRGVIAMLELVKKAS